MRAVSRVDTYHHGSGGGPNVGAELRATLTLALPLAAGNLAQMAMGVTTTVMTGRLGGMALAAVGLGRMLYFSAGIVLQGILLRYRRWRRTRSAPATGLPPAEEERPAVPQRADDFHCLAGSLGAACTCRVDCAIEYQGKAGEGARS